jgi:hypothetical protein
MSSFRRSISLSDIPTAVAKLGQLLEKERTRTVCEKTRQELV